VALFAGFPFWWLVGLVDVSWIVMAAVMGLYLMRTRDVRAPRGFGWWLLFLLWMLLSAGQLDTLGRAVGFTYRALIYVSAGVLLVYVYNARASITERGVAGLMTVFWGVTVVGGYLGLLLPSTVYRTPLSYVLPGVLLDNELVNHMVIRRFAQYNPDGWFVVDPRPSAPFLYTNNWGNAYSLLLPFVIVYLVKVRRERRFWAVLALIPVSLVPALLTLNRGMFLGLGVAALYLALRYLLMGNGRVLLAVLGLGVVAGLLFTQLSVDDQLDSRVEGTSTTEDRAEIYRQTIISVQDSPLFGLGAPRPSANPNIPPVGTHGQFWMVMHSHGLPGVLFFMGWFVSCFVRSIRRKDVAGVHCNSIVLVGIMEALYYGFLPAGLPLLMMGCALALRAPEGDGHARRHRAS
jgi:O-antigen ligase